MVNTLGDIGRRFTFEPSDRNRSKRPIHASPETIKMLLEALQKANDAHPDVDDDED